MHCALTPVSLPRLEQNFDNEANWAKSVSRAGEPMTPSPINKDDPPAVVTFGKGFDDLNFKVSTCYTSAPCPPRAFSRHVCSSSLLPCICAHQQTLIIVPKCLQRVPDTVLSLDRKD